MARGKELKQNIVFMSLDTENVMIQMHQIQAEISHGTQGREHFTQAVPQEMFESNGDIFFDV